MSARITSQELNERATKRAENKTFWKLCQKCEVNEWEKQYCKCPACSTMKIPEKRMYVHINQMNPFTIGWNEYDKETDSYPKGVADAWELCNSCSRKYQVYANWS